MFIIIISSIQIVDLKSSKLLSWLDVHKRGTIGQISKNLAISQVEVMNAYKELHKLELVEITRRGSQQLILRTSTPFVNGSNIEIIREIGTQNEPQIDEEEIFHFEEENFDLSSINHYYRCGNCGKRLNGSNNFCESCNSDTKICQICKSSIEFFRCPKCMSYFHLGHIITYVKAYNKCPSCRAIIMITDIFSQVENN